MICSHQLTKYLRFPTLSVILAANLGITAIDAPTLAQTTTVSSVKNSVNFTCNDTEATIKAQNGAKVTSGTTTMYIGYQQVSSEKKDPRIIRFDNGVKTWCRNNYVTTGNGGSGYGLLWDGVSVLYGVFSSTGNNFQNYTTGWLTSYGSGGGPKVAVIARINPANGDIQDATFLIAKILSGESNNLIVKSLSWDDTNLTLTVQSDSWWRPLRPDKSPMNCPASSSFPLTYTTVFTSNLKTVSSASATGCS
ncbi:hypothetical protein [Anabaena sp. PCC 7108]|uniref:hypothetical protein n=1 Tax=Anabaena sp. PCC 7108 TaxID=163908 RepID=UPI000345777F|nr:hypothetical protein [Anabaena sp. PCC 7108]